MLRILFSSRTNEGLVSWSRGAFTAPCLHHQRAAAGTGFQTPTWGGCQSPPGRQRRCCPGWDWCFWARGLFASLLVSCCFASVLRRVLLFATPCDRQALLSMGFSRQEYWSRLPFSPPEVLPDPGIEPTAPSLPGGFFTTEPPGNPFFLLTNL